MPVFWLDAIRAEAAERRLYFGVCHPAMSGEDTARAAMGRRRVRSATATGHRGR